MCPAKSTPGTVWSLFIRRAYLWEENPSRPLRLFAGYEYHCMELKPALGKVGRIILKRKKWLVYHFNLLASFVHI